MRRCIPFAAIFLSAAVAAAAGMAQTPQIPEKIVPPTAAPAKLPGPPTVTGPSRIGIINIREAITTTAEGKRLLSQVQARFTPRQTDLTNRKSQITALEKKLADGKSTMSASAQQVLSRQIQTEQRDFNQTFQDDEQDYSNAQTEVLNTVGNKMMPLVEAYAKQHGYTTILDVSFGWPQSPVVYYNPGANITGDIVRLYDQKYPAAAGAGSSQP